GWTGEERKMISELRRVFEDDNLQVNPTCVRVPVLRAHSQSVLVTLKRTASEDEVRTALGGGEGLSLLDDRLTGKFPTPLRATGQDEVYVGRLRSPEGRQRSLRWNLWLCGDQLRKGAALNAIQCAERWLELNSEAD
ncbi:MAG: Asd/ArgC dimerization domain-containing protein, partial [Planctomycetota bacterium]